MTRKKTPRLTTVEGDFFEFIEEQETLMSVKEVAAMIGCSLKHVYRLVEAGRIPVVRVGSLIRFDPRALAAWLRSRAA